MKQQLFKVHFHGKLAKDYGKDIYEVYGVHLKDVFSGLTSRFGQKFQDTILNGAWHITSGKRNKSKLTTEDNFISENEIEFPLDSNELHVFPAVMGAGGKGVGQIILGVLLIIIAVVLIVFFPPAAGGALFTVGGFGVSATAAALAVSGVMSIAQGVMAMMTKTPTMNDYAGAASVDQRASFLYNGAVNNTEQGVPVPLIYGRHLSGSTVISAGMDVEQI